MAAFTVGVSHQGAEAHLQDGVAINQMTPPLLYLRGQCPIAAEDVLLNACL
jgi:hypothetical protein